MSFIVVGVDGSEHADAALRFAAAEAAVHGVDLHVVCAWELPSTMTMDLGLVSGIFEGFRDEAAGIINEAIDKVAEWQPGVTCEGRLVEGHPATVLVQEAEGAILLVVGSRGRGELAGMLLGSVSHHVIHQAPCPVTVVTKRPEAKS